MALFAVGLWVGITTGILIAILLMNIPIDKDKF